MPIQAKRRRPARPSLMSGALAEALRDHRAKYDLRQEDVARQAGVTTATVQRLERGHWPSDPSTLEQVLIAYGQMADPPIQLPQLWGAALRQLVLGINQIRTGEDAGGP